MSLLIVSCRHPPEAQTGIGRRRPRREVTMASDGGQRGYHEDVCHARRAAQLLSGMAWGAIASATLASRGQAQGMPPSLEQFLQQTIGVTQDELTAAANGKPVVKVLEPSDHREIAVFGIVSIAVPRSFYVDRAADFPSSIPNPSRSRFALFSDPATAADVAAFSLPHGDVQDLARCRSGSCKLKLSAKAIAYLRTHIDSASPSADSIANAYFRERMVDYVTAYRAGGNAALIVYDDEQSESAADQVFGGILSRSPYMYQYAPSLERYLRNYPKDRPAGVREVLFWAEDDLPSARPTLTIAHEVVYAPPELPGSTLIAVKQLYADHYLDGGLDLTAVVDQAEGPSAAPGGIYLLLLSRLHFDNLPSGGLINIRGRVIGKLKDRTAASLRAAKAESERAYANVGASSR